MRIPEIRKELGEIAERLAVLTKELERRPAKTRAPATSAPMTHHIAIAIRAFKRAHPDASHVEIGKRYGVNPGRVSEALRGKRK